MIVTVLERYAEHGVKTRYDGTRSCFAGTRACYRGVQNRVRAISDSETAGVLRRRASTW